jgi:hypothetical protein
VKQEKVRKEYRYGISIYILISYIKNYLLFTPFPPPSISAKMQCNAILQYKTPIIPEKNRIFAGKSYEYGIESETKI